ncbi:MAG: helix-turn-helix transcriptional regulator, partial [Acidobacteriota bacterium]
MKITWKDIHTGTALRHLAEERGLTIGDLASMLGKTESTIAAALRQPRGRWDTVADLAEAMDVGPVEFLLATAKACGWQPAPAVDEDLAAALERALTPAVRAAESVDRETERLGLVFSRPDCGRQGPLQCRSQVLVDVGPVEFLLATAKACGWQPAPAV